MGSIEHLTDEQRRAYVYARNCRVCRDEPVECEACAGTGRELTKEGKAVLLDAREPS